MIKLNLGCGNDIRPDYINIDIVDGVGVTKGNVINLDWIAEDLSVDEILAMHIIEYVPYKIIDHTISMWCNKLKVGGKIKISSYDVCGLANDLYLGKIDVPTFLMHVFGKQNNEYDTHRCVVDNVYIRNKLQICGCTIDKIIYTKDNKFYIEATRNA